MLLQEKLAPVTNSQRNEALHSVVDSKNPKIRFYGGSESNGFRVACGVPQTNLRCGYISGTLEALNTDHGMFCYKFNEQMTMKVNQDKIRKSTVEFKRQRYQIHANNCSQTARKEAREGTTYETSVVDAQTSDSVTDTTANLLIMSDIKFKEIDGFVSKYMPRPIAKQVNFNEGRYYNFLVLDTETNCSGKAAEICQLSATDISGAHTFSKYILPVHEIDFCASKVNKLKIINVKGERKLLNTKGWYKHYLSLKQSNIFKCTVTFQKFKYTFIFHSTAIPSVI